MASTIKVDNVQNQPGTNIVSKCGTDVTLGASGDTVALAAGASQTGFGRTGTVDWDTASIKTTGFTAVSGNGYFCNTNGGAFTATLPASPTAGDIVAVADYTRTFATYNLTIGRNSKPIGGVTQDAKLTVNGQSATFVFVDDTEGWINTQETQTSQTGLHPFIVATGGTPCVGATCGDFKVHTFTGPGTFCVSAVSGCSPASNEVSYVIVAGGGGAGNGDNTGGGGAGGFRESKSGVDVYSPASPLEGSTNVTVTATAYPIVVGGGGAGGAGAGACGAIGTQGDNSVFACVTSTGGGGGGGGRPATPDQGTTGGSGGGNGHTKSSAGGVGNTPSTSPAQGTSGGAGAGCSTPPAFSAGAGGGATVAGAAGSPSVAGAGGTGATTSITGAAVARSGGGGGGAETDPAGGAGGTGGGGAGKAASGIAGIDYTGGGGGGTGSGSPNTGGNGGSGTVIIRYKFQ